MREVRRRTRFVGAFPDGNAALLLVSARLRYVAGKNWRTKRYLDSAPRTPPPLPKPPDTDSSEGRRFALPLIALPNFDVLIPKPSSAQILPHPNVRNLTDATLSCACTYILRQ